MTLIPAHIIELIDKYISGTANAAETTTLNNWYRSFNDAEITIIAAENISKEILEKNIKNRIDNSINRSKQKPVYPIFSFRKIAAVIILIIGLGMGMYYLTSTNSKIENKILATISTEKASEKIVPGGNKALLTLADGSTIILDSVQNGNLTKQGNIQIKKLQNGLLVYTFNGKTLTKNDAEFYNTISTPNGGEYQVTLSDGTKVWLNAASSIRFPVVFNNRERKVFITGEAYFEVAQKTSATQDKIPFLVAVNNNSFVKVLGTHFNINAYNDEPVVKTSLVEGSVKVFETNEAEAKLLSPGQQASLAPEGKISIINNADMEEALAWKNGKFQFKSADIETMLRQIARWYDVEVIYKGRSALHFTGQLNRTENVFKIFEKLQLTGEVHFTVAGRTIMVTP